jgi:group I intron endonuclease
MARVCGAYAIICQDGRAYVGGSKNIAARWRQHKCLLRKNRHPNRKLQGAWAENGPDAFSIIVLEVALSDDELLSIEQRWIDKMQSVATGFNLAPNAGSSAGHKLGPEARQRLSDFRRGKPKSAIHRAGISASKTGLKNPSAKLAVADIVAIRKLADDGTSRRELAAQFGVCYTTISNIVRRTNWQSLPSSVEEQLRTGEAS